MAFIILLRLLATAGFSLRPHSWIVPLCNDYGMSRTTKISAHQKTGVLTVCYTVWDTLMTSPQIV